jgi:hypothetical protein
MRRFLSSKRTADADQNSLQSERPPTYTSHVTSAPTYTSHVTPAPTYVGANNPNDRVRAWSASVPSASILSAPDSSTLLDETESSLTDTVRVVETTAEATSPTGPRYSKRHSHIFTPRFLYELISVVYYRIYAEDGVIPSKTSATPDDVCLGRINAKFVPPPHNVNSLKRRLAKAENIDYRTRTSLFLTPYSQSPMDDAGKVSILNRTGPGSLPQEPLALVAMLTGSERSALESGERSGLASTSEPCTTSPDIQYRTHIYSIIFLFITSGLLFEVYYLLYANHCEMPSKVAIDPEEPWLGRIRVDSIAPPHTPSSITRHISRVERTLTLMSSHLFADISCDTPLTEGYISILRRNGPGWSPKKPMAVVQVNIRTLVPEGTYVIKHREGNCFWNAGSNPMQKVCFYWMMEQEAKTAAYTTVNKRALSP